MKFYLALLTYFACGSAYGIHSLREVIIQCAKRLQINILPTSDTASLVDQCINQVDQLEQNKLILSQYEHSKLENIKLSIVVEFVDRNFVDDLIKSIAAQDTTFEYELICVCNSESIVKVLGFKDEFKHFKAILKNDSDDICHKNVGFLHCRSDLIFYLSQYDILSPHLLQRLVDWQTYTGSEVIILNNIIALLPGELVAVPAHDKFYTNLKMGSLFYDLSNLINNDEFTWGLIYGPKLFNKSVLFECGGLIGLAPHNNRNLSLFMLLKGYKFRVLTNGFCYQYYLHPNWHDKVLKVDLGEQLELIDSYFPEFFDSNLWQQSDVIESVLLAYTSERCKKFSEAYKYYLLAIKGGIWDVKIFLKSIRAFLRADLSIDMDPLVIAKITEYYERL